MKEYLDFLRLVKDTGVDRTDRTGVGTRSIFGHQMRFDLRKGFPLLTTKKMAWNAIVSELLWFIEGSTDERRLAEILHGTRTGNTIWTENANAPYWKDKAQFEGDLGRVYGKQMREWTNNDGDVFDQLSNVIQSIKNDHCSRRHLVINYNPGELHQMALPACHSLFQFYVSDGELSCQLYARSQDLPLGTPFNIASYALLTHMIAHVTGLSVGDYIHTSGDSHIYLNQLDTVYTQLGREPLKLPTLWLNPAVTDLFAFTMADIRLEGYEHHPAIKYPFAT